MRRQKRLKRALNAVEGANAYNAITTSKQAFEWLDAMGMFDEIRNNPQTYLLLHRVIKGINNSLREWGNDSRIIRNPDIEPRL